MDSSESRVCSICKESKSLVSFPLGVCADCIRNRFSEALPRILAVHKESREKFNLPYQVKSAKGILCSLCGNECRMEEGERGFCGIKVNKGGRIHHLVGTPRRGWLSFYYDPLPTNCVAEWVCPERTNYGYYNLAVFYNSCTFNCLFCQNWHFRQAPRFEEVFTAEELVEKIGDRVRCICYFGGDPSSQILHAIKTSRLALKKKKVRICWETNGNINSNLLKEVASLSWESGGIIKFDLKAYEEKINIALTGVSNRKTLENFAYLARWRKRENPPFLVASTLLVPGYIEKEEVFKIASFISSLDPEIPYTLLAFYPAFLMSDLPTTSRKQAMECLESARRAGLKRARVGNAHLLS